MRGRLANKCVGLYSQRMPTPAPLDESQPPRGGVAPTTLGQSIVRKVDDSIRNTPSEIKGNFFKVAAFQIILRTGWIFKTESIVMPAVLDTIGGAAWLRGVLPMLNRFGQSIPPLLASGFVKQSRLKKRYLAGSALVMGGSFLALSLIWYQTEGKSPWLPVLFLLIYGIFFIAVGMLNLSLSTLIGKAVRTERRGRLMLCANIGGATVAVICAIYLLPQWLTPESGSFNNIFAFAGIAFAIAGVLSLFLKETPDELEPETFSPRRILRQSLETLIQDPNFRRLSIIGALFGLSLTLLPHYQAMGRKCMNVGLDSLIPWLIAQNIGVACFSLPAGWLADRFGNRLVLRLLLGGLCLAPVLALLLSTQGEAAKGYYIWVFVLLGLTPVTFRTFSNYTLELVGREEQPRYLSTLSLCIAIPTMTFSSLLGLAVDYLDFAPVFILVLSCLVVAWLLVTRLGEPRYDQAS